MVIPNDKKLKLLLYMYCYWKVRKARSNDDNALQVLRKKPKRRRMWVRQKFGVSAHLVKEMELNDVLKYKNFFRMGPEAFEILLSLVESHIQKVDIRRAPISPKIRLGITLRYVASGDSMASLSYLFRVGYSTVSMIISETMKVIWEVLKDRVLMPPDEEKWKTIASIFKERWNFPNCIGAIDGKHVVMQAPPHAGSEFYNYKGTHSIILLALVDAVYTFSIVDVGAQGRQSDGGVFQHCTLGQRLRSNSLNIPPPCTISEGRPPLPYVVVGDEAFPLMLNLLRPYAQAGGLDLDRKIFNYRLSRARMLVENTFGILASRWRIYGKPIIAKLENVDNIVKATICLHNFIMTQHNNLAYFHPSLVDREVNGQVILGTWRQYSSQLQPIGRLGPNNATMNATGIREEFKNYFNGEGAIPWQWNRI